MFELALRVIVSMALVLGLLWLAARASARRLGGGSRSLVRVVGRQPLARSASLAVVEVGERVLVLGVSEQGVSLLAELDPAELPAAHPAGAPDGGTPPLSRVLSGSVPAGSGLAGSGLAGSGLAGSVLSGQTWRQAWTLATGRKGGDGA